MGNLAQLPNDLLVQQIQNGLILLALGMGVVFCFLVILILSTKIMSKLVNRKPKEKEVIEVKRNNKAEVIVEEPQQVIATSSSSEPMDVVAPMSGLILRIEVKEGQAVKKNQILMVMEAMKMENEIFAPCDGIIGSIKVKCGDQLNLSDLLVTINPSNKTVSVNRKTTSVSTPKAQVNNTVSSAPQGDVEIKAPMPGAILKLAVKVGDSVSKNQSILVMEAMKMENEVFAPVSGVVKTINIKAGDQVNPGDIMVIIGSGSTNNTVSSVATPLSCAPSRQTVSSAPAFVPKPATPMKRTTSTAPARRTSSAPLRRAVTVQRPSNPISNKVVIENESLNIRTEMKSPLSGQVLKVNVKVGDKVKKNQLLLVMEAMKMENEIFSPCDGTISSINVKQGQQLNNDDLLLIIG